MPNNIPEFYVLNPNRKEVKELLKRMVANGATKYDELACGEVGEGWCYYYPYIDGGCFGYIRNHDTITSGVGFAWRQRAKQLTMNEVRVLLPLPSDDEDKQP